MSERTGHFDDCRRAVCAAQPGCNDACRRDDEPRMKHFGAALWVLQALGLAEDISGTSVCLDSDCPSLEEISLQRTAVTRANNKVFGCLLAAKALGAYPQLSQISEIVFVCTRYQVFLPTFYTQPVLSGR